MDGDRFTPGDLPRAWHERADYLQQFGDLNSARLWRLAAVELERALEAFGAETLTLVEAAKFSGYSPSYIGKLIAAGALPNAGRKNDASPNEARMGTRDTRSPSVAGCKSLALAFSSAAPQYSSHHREVHMAKQRSASKAAPTANKKQGPMIRIAKVKSLSDRETLVRVTAEGKLSSKDAERCGRKTVAEFVGIPAKS